MEQSEKSEKEGEEVTDEQRKKEVRRDLRELRKVHRCIDVTAETILRHEKMLAYAEEKEKERIKKLIRMLKGDIRRAVDFEEKYMQRIMELEQTDRIIMFEKFVNGTPYWKIGKKVYLSEGGVRSRVERIFTKFAEKNKK